MSENFARTAVATAPIPATSGTALTVTSGHGARLYAGTAVLHPVSSDPTPANAEVVTITDVTGDVVTITRAQESSTARTVVVGDVLTQGITAGDWDALVAASTATVPLARGGTGATTAADARTALGLGSAATMTPATIAADPSLTSTYARLAPDWTTGRAYVVGELVTSGGVLYRCVTAHTSGASINLSNFAALGASLSGPNTWTGVQDFTGATLVGTMMRTVRVNAPLQQPNTSAGSGMEAVARMLATVAVATSRWRLKLANRQASSTTTVGTTVIAGVYVGTPARSASGTFVYSGQFAATPTQIDTGGTAPANAFYVTPWVTDPAQQFAPGVPRLLSWGFSATAGAVFDTARTSSWQTNSTLGSGVMNNAGQLSPGVGASSAWLDCIVECEAVVPSTTVIALFVGSSLTEGNGAHQYQSVPGQTERRGRGRLLAINAAVAGGSAPTSSTAPVLARLDFAGASTPPDVAVVEGDTNAVKASATIAQLQTGFEATVAAMRTLGAKLVIASTIPPGNTFSASASAKLTADVASGVTSLTMDANPGNGVPIVIGDGWYQESRTTGTVTGSGPFTVPITVATTRAHFAGEYAVWGKELVRKGWNDLLRNSMISAVDQVVDSDMLLAAQPGAPSIARQWVQSDDTHYTLAGNAAVAALI